MNLEKIFSEQFLDAAFFNHVVAVLGESVSEEFPAIDFEDMTDEEIDTFCVQWVVGDGFKKAIDRLNSTGAFADDKVIVYRGIDVPADKWGEESGFVDPSPYGRSVVSYSLSFDVAKQFARSQGCVVKNCLSEDEIDWKSLVFLHLAHPGCSDYELEIPAKPVHRRGEVVWSAKERS